MADYLSTKGYGKITRHTLCNYTHHSCAYCFRGFGSTAIPVLVGTFQGDSPLLQSLLLLPEVSFGLDKRVLFCLESLMELAVLFCESSLEAG